MVQTKDSERSGIKSVILDLMQDVQTLVRQEIALAKHEIEYESGKIFKAILWWVIAAILGLVGCIVITATCVLILFEYTGLPAWGCAAIVGAIVLGGAWGIAMVGRGVAKSIHLVPFRAIQTLTDDANWVAEGVRQRFE